jgi:excinuclease ABC subunit A
MSKSRARKADPAHAAGCIRLRGVRQNNLKNFELDIPTRQLVVVTGLSGSGKSSLAFDTLYAEGQRRYIETFSPYARQFFDRMDKPAVDRIENIPPAIAIEQRNAVRTTRSTVGTMTEVCDHMKVLWAHLARLHCRQCGQVVRPEPPQTVWVETSPPPSAASAFPTSLDRAAASSRTGADSLADSATPYGTAARPAECLITFDLPLSGKLELGEQLDLLRKQGFLRLLTAAGVVRLEDLLPGAVTGVRQVPAPTPSPTSLTVVVDRLRTTSENRARFVEACEQAYHFGRGRLAIRRLDGSLYRAFSSGLHCALCDIEYREPSASLFSFNNPVGACPACKGFGRIIGIDADLAMPDRSKSLAEGFVRPWQTGVSAECQVDLLKAAKRCKVPTQVPFRDLSPEHQRWVVEGEDGYDPADPARSWPKLWYGVKGYFRWLESKAYKMHVRVLLSRYRSYRTCPDCHGRRFNPESLLHRLAVPPGAPSSLLTPNTTLAEFYGLSLANACQLVDALVVHHQPQRHSALGIVLSELQARLGFLVDVGLGYLTLDRPTRTLSGGETERVNLTTCLGSRLVNTLYVLDEPSVGLHPRDTGRLIRILHRLRDLGNTVIVVEHESAVMRAADHIIDLGPGHGETGGHVVFQGSPADLQVAKGSLTADYLTGRRTIAVPPRRPLDLRDESTPRLTLSHVTRNNLSDVEVQIPLQRLVAITGVSGSGKTTLIREVLLPLLESKFAATEDATAEAESGDQSDAPEGASVEATPTAAEISGIEHLGAVVLVDQSSLGRTPRSNPAVYIGAFEDIRDVFAASAEARERGLNSSAFSFNSATGQCERCRGAGFEKIEMQFLSDVFIRCPVCHGRRYRQHILDVKLAGPGKLSWSIGDLLEAPIDDAVAFLRAFPKSKPARRAADSLQLLVDVGLGYLRCGQPINTLSGGESQRLKLVSHLASWASTGTKSTAAGKPTLFLFDEPTTGLHFEDIRVLMLVFQRMVDQGHSVVVVEHNLDVIRQADWVIDLGPDAGDQGGQLVVAGTPETVAAHPTSHTGHHLRAQP